MSFKRRLLTPLLIAGILCTPTMAADGWKMVLRVKGKVETKLVSESNWKTVIASRFLKAKEDRFRTLEDSIGKVRTSDGAVITVGPKTDVSVAEFEERTGGMKIKVNSSKGSVRAYLKNLVTPRRRYEIETPNAVLSAKGTDYVVLWNPDMPADKDDTALYTPGIAVGLGPALLAQGGGVTYCQVFEGSVEYSRGQNSTLIQAGNQALIDGGGINVGPANPNAQFIPDGLRPEAEGEKKGRGTVATFFTTGQGPQGVATQEAAAANSGAPILVRPEAGNTGTIEIQVQLGTPMPSPSPGM